MSSCHASLLGCQCIQNQALFGTSNQNIDGLFMHHVGHVEATAKDKWGSLVICAILSYVDDTVLVRKIILPTLQVICLPIFLNINDISVNSDLNLPANTAAANIVAPYHLLSVKPFSALKNDAPHKSISLLIFSTHRIDL